MVHAGQYICKPDVFRDLLLGMCITFIRDSVQVMRGSEFCTSSVIDSFINCFIEALDLRRLPLDVLFAFTCTIQTIGGKVIFAELPINNH